jgi:hypothetical protein
MANALYDTGRDAFLNAAINWTSDSIKAVLVNIAGGHYTVNLATDQFLSSILLADRVATVALAGKSSAAGVANASNVTFPTVSGAACGAVVLYKDTGVAGTSQLIAYIDTATGLPVTPGGGDIVVSWDTGSNKIFKL